MPRNGSGTYVPPSSSWYPAVDGQAAETDDWNGLAADLSDAISDSISADGQTPIVANIPMSGFKFTGLAAGSTAGDSVRYEQVQPIDATLTALAALTTAASEYIRATGVDTFTMDNYAAVASNIQNSFTSGTYTPTLTNTTNVAASTAYVCSYIRIGNTVFVSGLVDIDVTSAGTNTVLGMSLPVASDFGATSDLGGTAVSGNTVMSSYAILADATNNRASIQGFSSSGTANYNYGFQFMYRVI